MIQIDEKIRQINERKKFSSFWELFDYMILANYDELEAMMTSLQLFDGKVWDRVLNAAKIKTRSGINNDLAIGVFSSGTSYTYSASTSFSIFGNNDPDDNPVRYQVGNSQPDDLLVEIFIMTNDALEAYKPMYKSYIETRKYKEEPELEKHIKSVTLKLTTELSIKLFNDGYKNFK